MREEWNACLVVTEMREKDEGDKGTAWARDGFNAAACGTNEAGPT